MAYVSLNPSNLRGVSSSKGRLIRLIAALLLLIFTATKISSNRLLVDDVLDFSESEEETSVQSSVDRNNCQIIYIIGVEGAVHHGFTPILETLARQQVDPTTGSPYEVAYAHRPFRAALFGFHREFRPIDDPELVEQTIQQICPPDGKKHVIIDDASFPSGTDDDLRTYRIHRQRWWLQSSMEQIAMSDTAQNHPTNLNKFYESYSPYANIKFVVLHRSYIETIASHVELNFTVGEHSNVIRGFMLLLRRFLDAHPVDNLTGQQLWTIVCVERLTNKFHGDEEDQMHLARQHILSYLAVFLGWPTDECPDCYSDWRTGKKNHLDLLGRANVAMLLEHMRKLGGIWPPILDNALPEQKCSL